LAVVSLLLASLAALRYRPPLGFLGASFFLILAPTSSIMPIADNAVEHRMYLPLAPLVSIVVVGAYVAIGRLICGQSFSQLAVCTKRVSSTTKRKRKRGKANGAPSLARGVGTEHAVPDCPRPCAIRVMIVGGCLVAVIATMLGVLTFQRNEDYQSEQQIWQDTVDKVPGNYRAHNSLAITLASRGQIDEAIAHFQKALKIKPDYADAHGSLGIALQMRGQIDEAIAHCRKAVEIQPKFAKAHFNLGNALSQKGIVDEAIAHYQKALEIKPSYVRAHVNLGNALLGRGRGEEAIIHFQRALAIEPHHVGASQNLGVALHGLGRDAEALLAWRHVLKIEPNRVPVLNLSAWILATSPDPSIRDGAEAIALAEYAARLSSGRDPAILDTLAAAYAEAGRFSEAVQCAQLALSLASDQGNTAQINFLRTRIERYQAGSPCRDSKKP